jgi:hypothetical protein
VPASQFEAFARTEAAYSRETTIWPVTLDSSAVKEAAQAARGSKMLVQARKLAEWVGEGKRVTPKAVLRPSDVPAAVQALGIPLPDRIRSAADIPALHRPWKVALGCGFLKIAGGQAKAGQLADADDETVLGWWLAALPVTFAAGVGEEDEVAAAALVSHVLNVLAAGSALSPVELPERIHDLVRSRGTYFSDAAHSVMRFLREDRELYETREGIAELVVEVGAAELRGKKLRVTSLGRWAEQETRAPEPVRPELPAAELLTILTGVSDVEDAVDPWLDSRTPVQAAGELLRAAADATPLERVLAIEIVDAFDLPAEIVWRGFEASPNLAAHARMAFSNWSKPLEKDSPDWLWLAAEYATAALIEAGPDEAWSCIDERLPGNGFDSRLEAIAGSGHPDAAELVDAVRAFIAEGGKPTATLLFQLKISLKWMREPSWRRVLVPATARLNELHQVIQQVMEWDGDHSHMFFVGDRHYGDRFRTPDFDEEAQLRLCDVLKPPTKTIRYIYDLKHDWTHAITWERTTDRKEGKSYPFCVTGKGDVPVEDWNEKRRGPDSRPFDLDKINTKLAELTQQ